MEAIIPDSSVLIIFARLPRPGKVKTRLIPFLGEEASAQLYACMLTDTVIEMQRLESLAPDVKVIIAWTELPDENDLIAKAILNVPSILQSNGNLGQRIHSAICEMLQHGFSRVAVIGSDMPLLTAEQVLEALKILDTYDVAIGPSDDGGYYCIAVKAPSAALFSNINWSSSDVLNQTLAQAHAACLQVSRLPSGYDIDTAEDVQRLQRDLQTNAPDFLSCFNTRRFLFEHIL